MFLCAADVFKSRIMAKFFKNAVFLTLILFIIFFIIAAGAAFLFAYGDSDILSGSYIFSGSDIFSDSDNLIFSLYSGSAGLFAQLFNQSDFVEPPPSYIDLSTPESASTSEHYTRYYSWVYDGHKQSFSISVSKEHYDYYRNKPHTKKNIEFYALSEDDRQFLGQMIAGFQEQSRRHNFTDDQTVLNVIAFVQSMPYTSDSVTTGYDEYPRYPIETLVDGGGDCEDSAILAAALLSEMGYETVLIGISTDTSGHAALGVRSDADLPGTYYVYGGHKYYYVETTASGYDFGEIPADYKGLGAEIFPLNPTPSVYVTISAELIDYNHSYASYNVRCTVTNFGPTPAQNVFFSVFAEGAPYDKTHLLSEKINLSAGTIPDDGIWETEHVLTISRRQSMCFSCTLSGDNFDPVAVQTNVIYIN